MPQPDPPPATRAGARDRTAAEVGCSWRRTALLLPACCRGLYFLPGVFLRLKEELKSVLSNNPRDFWRLFCVRTVAASKPPAQWQAWDLFPAISGGGKRCATLRFTLLRVEGQGDLETWLCRSIISGKSPETQKHQSNAFFPGAIRADETGWLRGGLAGPTGAHPHPRRPHSCPG